MDGQTVKMPKDTKRLKDRETERQKDRETEIGKHSKTNRIKE